MSFLKRQLVRLLRTRPVSLLPVRVRGGLAEGARWTLFPWTAYWRGVHEPEVQARLTSLWDWRGKQVWDLGSHYGLFTVGLGLRVGPNGSVAAFEPNPLSFDRLSIHVRRNRLSWVKTFPIAASDFNGAQPFFAYDGLESTTTHLAYEHETRDETTPTITVECRRLDDLVAQGTIVAPDFIKVDVEGHGHKALAGAQKTILKSRPTIVCGMHSDEEAEGVRSIFDPLDYTYTPLTGTGPSVPTSGRDYLIQPRREHYV